VTDLLPVLTTTDPRHAATKTWRRTAEGWHKVDFAAGMYFTQREVEVEDINDLARVLEQLSAAPRSFVIRGRIKDATSTLVRRKLKGVDAAFDPAQRRYIMLDFDKIELPLGHDLHDPAVAVKWLIDEHLPEPFHDTTTWWQLSASAGVEDQTTISVHLWYWLDRAIADDELKAYFKINAPTVDDALFNAVQIHYTARPIFEGGSSDPIPVRQGLMEREDDQVVLPDIDIAELKTSFNEIQKSDGIAVGGSLEDRLAQMGDGPGRLGFHAPIRDAIMAYVRGQKVEIKLADMQALKARVRESIHAAPKRPGRDVETYLSDQYLDSSIQGAIARKSALLIDTASREGADDTYLLEDAETRLQAAIEDFLGAAQTFDPDLDEAPPIHAIAAELGLGKTEIVLQRIAASVDLTSTRIQYYVPTHKLSAEVRDRFNAMLPNGEARVWKGRSRVEDGEGATDLDGNPMCFDDVREKADMYEKAGISVSEHFCPTCPHLGSCGWSRQMEDKGPGLVLMPVQYAFEASAERADIQIFDETFWQAAMRDATVSIGALSINEIVPGRKGGDDIEASADLTASRAKLKAAFAENSSTETGIPTNGIPENYQTKGSITHNGIPSIPALLKAGITSEIAKWAKAIEHQRADAIMGIFKPSMTVGTLERAWEGFRHRDARRWARVWSMIEDQIDLDRDRLHGFRRYVTEDNDGDPKDVLAISWSRDLRADSIPTLVLDATLNESIIRRFLPGLQKIERIHVNAAHAHVTQITDRVVSKAMIAPDIEKGRPEELKRKRNRVRDLARIMEVIGKGKVGLFTYEKTETELLAGAVLPDNVLTAHFNNFRGLDLWRDADAIVVAGRPQPGEAEVEKIAEGLFYKIPDQIIAGAKYGKTLRTGRETDAHPDPLVEAVRYQICEAELIQAIGRARGIRRTEVDPVEIVILTSVVLPIAVNEVTTWDELVPDRWGVMAARGVVFEAGADAAAAYPDLFATSKAFREASPRRQSIVPSPYIYSPIGERDAPRRVKYQVAGNGQRNRGLAYDPAIIPDIRAWLTARLDVEIVRLVEEVPPVEIEEEAVETELADYTGGIVPEEVRYAVRAAYRAAGITQEQAATLLGLSRPQLANALQGRYGLGVDKVIRLRDFLEHPPPVMQMSLF